MPLSKLQKEGREIARKRSQASKEATASRKRMVTKATTNKQSITVTVEPMPTEKFVSPAPAPEVIPVSPVTYIGGKREVSIDRETLSLFHENKLLNDRAYVILCLCMEYGANTLSSGMEFFEGTGELSKFALAYNMEPAKVLSVMAGIKGLVMPLEKMNLQMQLDLSFAGE